VQAIKIKDTPKKLGAFWEPRIEREHPGNQIMLIQSPALTSSSSGHAVVAPVLPGRAWVTFRYVQHDVGQWEHRRLWYLLITLLG